MHLLSSAHRMDECAGAGAGWREASSSSSSSYLCAKLSGPAGCTINSIWCGSQLDSLLYGILIHFEGTRVTYSIWGASALLWEPRLLL